MSSASHWGFCVFGEFHLHEERCVLPVEDGDKVLRQRSIGVGLYIYIAATMICDTYLNLMCSNVCLCPFSQCFIHVFNATMQRIVVNNMEY